MDTRQRSISRVRRLMNGIDKVREHMIALQEKWGKLAEEALSISELMEPEFFDEEVSAIVDVPAQMVEVGEYFPNLSEDIGDVYRSLYNVDESMKIEE